jgi:hypothetical protein
LGAGLALALVAGAGFAVWRYAFDAAADEDQARACPAPPARTAKPTAGPVAALRPQQVRLNVYNATTRDGLASRTAWQLKQRGFAVGKVGNDPLERHVGGVAEVRSGAKATLQVALVKAHVPGATAAPDRRTDATVDLVIGNAFRRLASAAQVQSAISPAATPTATAPKRGC